MTWALRGYSKDADVNEKVGTAMLLLQYGADVQSSDARGMTPLMWAASFGELQVVRVLLARGADVRAKDNAGRTAVQYAAAEHAALVLKVLRAHGGR